MKNRCTQEDLVQDIFELFEIDIPTYHSDLIEIGLSSYDLISLIHYELIKYKKKSVNQFVIDDVRNVVKICNYINSK